MNVTPAQALLVGALLFSAVSSFGGPSDKLPVAGTSAPLAAFPVEVPAPVDVSADGEWMLLFLPGGQGFELVNSSTGERNVVSTIPNTGYFASISPDKKYVCFKAFQPAGERLLQIPVLYDIAQRKQLPLADPAPAVGNPVASSRGQIAYTVGERLIVLNGDLKQVFEAELGTVANVLAFSPDGRRLAFSDPEEVISWIDVKTGRRGGPPADGLRGYQPRFSPDGQGLLARRSNGEITGWRGGVSRNFGPARSAAWLDNDAVALVRQDVEKFAVSQTRVERRQFANGTAAPLLTRKGDAAIVVNASVIALNAEDGVSLADPRTGLSRKPALAAQPVAAAASTYNAELAPAPQAITPKGVTTNGTTIKLSPVPYVNQVYDTDPNFPGGGSCCNATATIMAIQYYNRLPPHPITCTQNGTHTSLYGFYISSKYSYNGHVFDIPSADWSLDGWYGGFGYFLQDTGGSSLQHSIRLKEYISFHSLTSATDDSTSYAKAKAEIDANHPIVVLNSLTSAGHYITCIGYIQGQYSLIFNDPYGNKNVSYPSANGAGAIYDWPGYNYGYQNLNTAWRYVYARGTVAVNTNWGSYWDLNAATAGAGTAPGGTWDSVSTNWSSSTSGNVATGPWYEQNATFAAGTDATGAYTVSVNNTQVVANLLVQEGTVSFTGGRLYFLGSGAYFTNYAAAGATAIFNTPFGGTGSPDKWGAGTAVYNGASTSTGYFTHNEGTLAFGNNSALSSARLEVGDQTGTKAVTLKAADSTTRTLGNYLSWKAATCNIGAGGDLTFSGPINVNSNAVAARIIAVSNNFTTFSGVLTNTCGITKTGPGTLVLSGSSANSYGSGTANGYTTVSGGTLKLSKTAGVAAVANGSLVVNPGGILLMGAANQIANTVTMTLAGGTFQTAGVSESLGTLKLTANSVIDLGAGASVLTFAASSGVAWTAGTTLTISNWNGSITGAAAERVLFGSSSAGLSAGQVGQVRFVNPPGFPAGSYAATILSTGEVVPYTAAPNITVQPQDKVAVAGSTVTFSSSVTGTPAPVLQWRLNGGNLSGATNVSLSLLNVNPGQAGTYSLVATNVAGTATSRSVQLTVYASAAPTLCGTACPSNGPFQFSVAGVPGCQYAILVSTNLTNWTPLQTNTSPFTFTDSNAGSFPGRFYRAQYVP